jgi:hypothetical protein
MMMIFWAVMLCNFVGSCVPAIHCYRRLIYSSSSLRYCVQVVLSSVMVIVLATGPRFAGLNPVEDNGFLRAIKIRSTISFGGEVKPSAPCFMAC